MLLLQRSGLDQQTLNLVFAHSDRDQDGRLQWVEFLCMAHLVTCVRRGAQLPGLHEGLPQELLQVLGSMTETPQDLRMWHTVLRGSHHLIPLRKEGSPLRLFHVLHLYRR